MNKTIIININGTIFHIEEDAYEVLRSYMTDVKRHFANEEDSMEITTDIENRIAEMFTEILVREARQVVITADVTTVISQMGTIEDFETGTDHANASYTDHQTFASNRKLFRDPDDHLLGGVCAGIANYFDVDAVWIRLAFAIAVIFGGTGLMAYIILWIIVPKANTRADKMAMKGEKLDLKGFMRNFEEEVKTVHHSLSNASSSARPFVYKVRDFVTDFFDHFKYFLGGAGKVILKLIGVLILLTCLGFIIAGSVVLTIIVAQGRDVLHLFPFSIVNDRYSIIYFSAFAVAVIPLLSIILLTLRVIFGNKVLGKSTSYTLLIFWILALSLLGYYSSKVAADFKEGAAFSQTLDLKAPFNNTYYLKLNDVKYLSREDSVQLDINSRFNGTVILNDEDDDEVSNRHESKPQNVKIYIERSDVAFPTLTEKFSARGHTEQEALRNARNASYYFKQKDTVLTFDRMLKVPFSSLWRNQAVELRLRIPQNSTLVIDKKLERYIENVSLGECNDMNKRDYNDAATFIMTNNGLQCKVDTVVVKTIQTNTAPDTTSVN
ncbi:phage shock protein C (PspC) family protein [Mucilaginibacter gracilis]|uniref:Phage shock protein C (PspC) family protein n=1 Tax=Mucilaginibacter gracilis TaxID=423350 RepID=A0A495IXG3_9SPHI|nr:PspC domain-containing protein [Mucilaginibacter gracilis]RKR81365.1 phage shock protein C (PspC) family protein [Mucilaginibacter gracilis]